jgi:hypothetical protein
MKDEFDIEKAAEQPSNALRVPTHEDRIHEPAPGEPLEQTPSKSPAATNFLTKTLSRVRTKDSVDPGPPPDGGFQAWFQACLGHLVIFNSWGYINSFGLFQTYYVNVMKIGGESSVAWIGTTQVFVLFGIGTFSGRGLDAGYFRIQFILGSIIYVTGMFLTSLCTKYYQIFLAQSICVGIGLGLCFVPTLALVSTYFLKKRSMGLAIAVTGSTIGGLVFPAIAESMLPSAGFPWTMRTMAFVQMALAIVTSIFLKVCLIFHKNEGSFTAHSESATPPSSKERPHRGMGSISRNSIHSLLPGDVPVLLERVCWILLHRKFW